MRLILKFDGTTGSGGTPLLMHNERLADPLNPFAKALAEKTGKRGKTDTDHEEIARREFMGGLYTSEAGTGKKDGLPLGVPVIPGWNVLRCLQDGAKRNKRGQDVLRGVYPAAEFATVEFDGPRAADELWRGGFWVRKGVGVGRSRVIRTRPMFTDWTAELPVDVDPTVFDVEAIVVAWRNAGQYCGIGDGRPIHGRFAGLVEAIDVSDLEALLAEGEAPTGTADAPADELEAEQVEGLPAAA